MEKETKNKRLQVRMTRKEYELLFELAKDKGLTVADFVRKSIFDTWSIPDTLFFRHEDKHEK